MSHILKYTVHMEVLNCHVGRIFNLIPRVLLPPESMTTLTIKHKIFFGIITLSLLDQVLSHQMNQKTKILLLIVSLLDQVVHLQRKNLSFLAVPRWHLISKMEKRVMR